MGESLHDMMLSRLGVGYDRELLVCLQASVNTEEQLGEPEVNVMTVRFKVLRIEPLIDQVRRSEGPVKRRKKLASTPLQPAPTTTARSGKTAPCPACGKVVHVAGKLISFHMDDDGKACAGCD